MPYAYAPFDYAPPPELSGGAASDAPVAIVGAGPIGLALAIDLALHGIKSVVLDDNDVVSVGSRAICWARRTLEIFDRLGLGDRMVEKGVTWRVGRLFRGDSEVYSFDLSPEDDHQRPAFINLQQYYVEQYLAERCGDFPDLIDLRWKNRVTGVENGPEGARALVETPDGAYSLSAAYLIACDGARSDIRAMLGLDFDGVLFEDRFLIADIEMQADFPPERWFWFEPPFHPGQTALLHKQPDNIYRIDLQLGWDADPEHEKKPENVIPRIERAVDGRPFTLDWVSVYTFQCRRLARFTHDRVIFAGDSAHLVSPFGARGGNGGVQDLDNLGWKLAAVLRGEAGPGLLASYDHERIHGTDENILNSARATNFMSPADGAERLFRDAVLDLAGRAPFARKMVNSGRLSVPCVYDGSPLNGPDALPGAPAVTRPGAPAPDAPLEGGWLLRRLGGRFGLLAINMAAPDCGLPVLRLNAPSGDAIARRYLGAAAQGVYLLRPDQHVAARWAAPTAQDVAAAHDRAMGRI